MKQGREGGRCESDRVEYIVEGYCCARYCEYGSSIRAREVHSACSGSTRKDVVIRSGLALVQSVCEEGHHGVGHGGVSKYTRHGITGEHGGAWVARMLLDGQLAWGFHCLAWRSVMGCSTRESCVQNSSAVEAWFQDLQVLETRLRSRTSRNLNIAMMRSDSPRTSSMLRDSSGSFGTSGATRSSMCVIFSST